MIVPGPTPRNWCPRLLDASPTRRCEEKKKQLQVRLCRKKEFGQVRRWKLKVLGVYFKEGEGCCKDSQSTKMCIISVPAH
jgi:hypothetical protein